MNSRISNHTLQFCVRIESMPKSSKSKPRIAFIMPDKIAKPVGGMGVQAKYLIENLKKDFDFDIYAFPEENDMDNYHSVVNPMFNIRHHGLRALFGQVLYVGEIIKNKKPDLIHVSDYTLFLAGVIASQSYKVPLVVSMQLSAHLMEQQGLTFSIDQRSIDGQAIQNAFKEMELLGLRTANKIIHVSKAYKDIFSKIPGIDQKSVCIPNGIDLEEYSKKNPNYKKVSLPGTRKLKVIFIGRFAPQKNVDSLNRAFVPDNIDLIFIGEKENENPIFQEMFDNTTRNENLHYYGPAYDAEKVNLLQAADAVIIPSRHECHPIVMHEAMAAGCIVIHSGAGDMWHVLKDDFAINCGDTPESISNALIQFSEMDPKEIERRKKESLKTVKNYTWEKAALQTKEVYDSLLK